MVTGIEHVGIFAKDTKALKDWYIEVLGFVEVYDNGKGTYFLKAPDGSMIEFVLQDDDPGVFGPKAKGIRHLALTVDDFDKEVEFLVSKKVEVVPGQTPAKSATQTFFFRDPEGNVLHLIKRTNQL